MQSDFACVTWAAPRRVPVTARAQLSALQPGGPFQARARWRIEERMIIVSFMMGMERNESCCISIERSSWNLVFDSLSKNPFPAECGKTYNSSQMDRRQPYSAIREIKQMILVPLSTSSQRLFVFRWGVIVVHWEKRKLYWISPTHLPRSIFGQRRCAVSELGDFKVEFLLSFEAK